jgi:hypothetical protein
MSAFRFLGHAALFMIGLGTASQAVAAPFGYSGLTSPSETWFSIPIGGALLTTVITGTGTVRMMTVPTDSKIAMGMAAVAVTEEVPASSFAWATLGLRRDVPTGRR